MSAGGSSWLCRLRSRAPDWDPGLRAFTLPFAGRARHSSVKNVQMVDVAAEASRAAHGRRRTGRLLPLHRYLLLLLLLLLLRAAAVRNAASLLDG